MQISAGRSRTPTCTNTARYDCGIDSRQVKCDEKHPSCTNCVRIGLRCPGFQQQQLRWSRKHERSESESSSLINPFQDQDQDQVQVVATSPYNNGQCNDILLPANRQVALDAPLEDTQHPEARDHCGGLNVVPATWSTDDDFPSLQTNEEDVDRAWDCDWPRDTGTTTETFVLPENQCNTLAASVSRSLHGLTHLPTMLIEYWFCYICPTRSTFDSDINFNRILAKNACARSEAVMYTMQAMSTACLLKEMPQLRKTSFSLRAKAISAINHTLTQVRTSNSIIKVEVMTDLIFAVFCTGTSQSWLASPSRSREDDPWLDTARELLCFWKRDPDAADTLVFAYFCQALTYWEMLLAAEGRGPLCLKVNRNQQERRYRLRQATLLPTDDSFPAVLHDDEIARAPSNVLLGSRPNSWCGISNEVIDMFGQVLALCRTTVGREFRYGNNSSVTELSNTLCDLSIAHELYRELASTDFNALVLIDEVQGFPVHTQDDNTPIAHLVQTAEAFRLAGLLQLELAFPDVAQRPEDKTNRCESFQADSIVASALQLASLLEQIPPESGSLSIHALLLLSVAAGLQFQKRAQKTYTRHHVTGVYLELSSDPILIPMSGQADYPFVTPMAPTAQHERNLGSGAVHEEDEVLPPLTWEICKARRFVRARLTVIQQKLPHRASSSVLEAVDAIWSESDAGMQHTHWFEVLEHCGLGITVL